MAAADTSNAQTPEPPIHFKCGCGRACSTPAVNNGKVIACKDCGNRIKIPTPAAPETAAASETQTDQHRQPRQLSCQMRHLHSKQRTPHFTLNQHMEGLLCGFPRLSLWPVWCVESSLQRC